MKSDFFQSRNVILDTRALKRSYVDFRQTILIAGFGVLLIWIGFGLKQPIASEFGILVFYGSVLASTARSRLLPIFILVPSILLFPSAEIEILRVALTASMMILRHQWRNSVLPMFILPLVWVAQLWEFPLTAATLSHHTFAFCFEFFGLSVLLMMLWSQRLTLVFGRHPMEVSSRSVFINFSLFSAFSVATLVIVFLLRIDGSTEQRLLSLMLTNTRTFGFLAAAVLLVPTLFGLALAEFMRGVIEQLRQLGNPNRRLSLAIQGIPVISEYRNAIASLRKTFEDTQSSLKEAQFTIKELSNVSHNREGEIAVREAELKNLDALMNLAPVGFLAVSGSGGILSVNRNFFTFLRIDEQTEVIGTRFVALAGDSPWRSEVLNYLNLVVRALKEEHITVPHLFFTTAQRGQYLRVETFHGKLVDLGLAESQPIANLPQSDEAIVCVVTEMDDLRDFSQRMLQAHPLEIAGAHAAEFSRELHVDTSGILTKAAEGLELVRVARTQQRGGIDAEVGLILKEVERLAGTVTGTLEQFLQDLTTPSKPLITHNLTEVLPRMMRQLSELAGLQDPLVIELDGDYTNVDPNDLPKIALSGHPSEIDRFLSYYLAFVRGIVSKATGIRIFLGYEKIGTGTANIIPGSAAGDYVRIVLEHPGQSIAGNMIQTNIQNIPIISESEPGIESALAILSFQVSRMNGFLSIQSSPSKGTNVAVYVPESPASFKPASKLIAHKKQQLEKKNHEARRVRGKALLIASKPARFQEVKGLLAELGMECQFETPEMLLDQPASDFEFDGAGFADESSSPEKVPSKTSDAILALDPSSFDLLVLGVDSENDLKPMLIEQLAAQLSSVPRLVLTPQSDAEAPTIVSSWPHLKYPCSTEELRTALNGLFRSA